MRFAIIDNDGVTVRTLTKYVQKYCSSFHAAYCCDVFQKVEIFAKNYSFYYTLLFLNVDSMRKEEVQGAIAKIRRFNQTAQIVLISSDPNRAIEGYSVEAVGFLVSPVSYASFAATTERAIAKLRTKNRSSILVGGGGIYHRIFVCDLLYVEVSGHDLIFHLSAKKIVVKGQLHHIEKQLLRLGFFRCSASFMVNLRHIEHASLRVVHVGGRDIFVSRNRRKRCGWQFFQQEKTVCSASVKIKRHAATGNVAD